MFRKQSEAELERGRKALARLGAIYRAVFSLPALVAIVAACWAFGYVQGYWDGWNRQPTPWQHKESKK